MSEIVLTFQPEGKRVKVEEGRSVLEAAQENGIDIVSICGGAGKCGKCKIIISKYAPVSGISKKERELLSEDEINKGIRLACLTKVFGDITIKVPESNQLWRIQEQIIID
ncbi:MAG: 2Fe-2S iron-sulfur cluster-binding protein [Candidatus Helarchaeota archaeon]